MVMTIERLGQILDAFGADPARWPKTDRDGALALLAHSREAQRLREEARRLDALLNEAGEAIELRLDAKGVVAAIKDATGNVHRLPKSRPKFSLIGAWPGFAGLAAAAAAGFIVGWMGLAADYSLGTQAQAADQVSGFSVTEVAPW
jgi:hypothetical protein